MAEAWERTQPCQDVFDQTRATRVFLTEHNRIGLQLPPGEMATYSSAELNKLQDDLADAVVEATHRGAEWG